MTYLGDINLGDTIDFKFATVNTSGVPTTLAGTPVVSAYPGNSTTQLTAGITLTVDFDGVTGLHNVRIVASSGNGYATATNYALVITTGTVSGSSVVGYVIGHFSIEARSALRPTVAARTLDVSATGEAGLDWANIGSPTTAQNLSATNIDVDQVVASVSGAVGSVTGNVGGNVTGSVGSVTGAVGSVTGNVGGNVTGSVGSIATNGIAASSIATGAITAAKFAANAIDAAALAADAVAEIQSGLATSAALATVQADTDNIQTRLPAALVSGRMDSSVGAMATDVLTAAALAADAVAEIQSGLSTLNAAGVRAAIGLASANLDTQLDALPTAGENADAVWDEPIAGHLGAGSTGAALNAAGSAGDPWTTPLPGAYGAGTAGNIIGANLNATVSSRLASASYTAPDNATITSIQADTNDIQTRLPAALVSGRMDSSVGAMAADTLTSSALAASAVTEIQAGLSTLTPAQVNTEVDTALADVGLTATVTGRIDVATSTRLASASYTAPDNATITAINAKTTNLPASPAAVGSAMTLTSGERDSIAAALLDLANGVETSFTVRQVLRLLGAAVAGELSGAATATITIRNLGDSLNRITATVDADGNRSAVTYNLG